MGLLNNDISINSSDSQALRDVIGAPIVNDSILDGSSLPSEYIEEKIIPELAKISDQKKLADLKVRVKGNKDLLSLIEDYTVKQFSVGTLPGTMSGAEKIRENTKNGFKSTLDFTKELSGLEDEKSKESRMRNEIIVRRRSIMAKFDQYVLQGDGKQRGNDTSWRIFDDRKDLTGNVANREKIQGSIHDTERDTMVLVLNEVAKVSMDDNLTGIKFFNNTLNFESKLDKLAFFASYLSAIEEGCDEVIPGIISQGIDTTTGVVGDTTKGLVDKGMNVLGGIGLGALSIAGNHWFVSGLLITAAVSTIKGKSMVGKFLRNKVARNIPKIGQYIPEAGVTTSTSGVVTPATPAMAGPNSGITSENLLSDTNFDPEINTDHRAVRDKITQEMFRENAMIQRVVLGQMHTEYLGDGRTTVADLDTFKQEIINNGPASSIGQDFEMRMNEIPETSSKFDLEEYRKEVLDITNEKYSEYESRVHRTLGALEKHGEAPRNKKLQQDVGRAVKGGQTGRTHVLKQKVETGKKRFRQGGDLGEGIGARTKAAIREGIVAKDPVRPNEALRQFSDLQREIKTAKTSRDVHIDGNIVTFEGVIGEPAEKIVTLEGEYNRAEAEVSKIQEKIHKAEERLGKELSMKKLQGGKTVEGSINKLEETLSGLRKEKGDILTKVDLIENKSVNRGGKDGGGKFDSGKLISSDKTTWNSAKAKLLEIDAKISELDTELKIAKTELVAFNKETKNGAKRKTETEIRNYIGGASSGLTKDLADAKQKSSDLKGEIVGEWARIAQIKKGMGITVNTVNKTLDIGGKPVEVKESSIKLEMFKKIK